MRYDLQKRIDDVEQEIRMDQQRQQTQAYVDGLIKSAVETERRRCADIADRQTTDLCNSYLERVMAEMIRNLILSETYDASPTNPAHGGKIWNEKS